MKERYHHHNHGKLSSPALSSLTFPHDDDEHHHQQQQLRKHRRQSATMRRSMDTNCMSMSLSLMMVLFSICIINVVTGEIFIPQTLSSSMQRKSLIHSPPSLNAYRGGGTVSGIRDRRLTQQKTRQQQQQWQPASIFPLQKNKSDTKSDDNSNDDDQKTSLSSLWPPWPFNLFLQSKEDNQDSIRSSERYRTNAKLIFSYIKHGLRIGVIQMRQVGSAVTIHLPPAAPPILLLALAPSSSKIITDATGDVVKKRTIPLFFANPSVQKLSLTTIGIAILSWAHSEAFKIHRLAPLPIYQQQLMESSINNAQTLLTRRDDLKKVVLPPFLPEEVASPPPPPLPTSSRHDDGEGDRERRGNIFTSWIDLAQEWRYERRFKKYEADILRRDTIYNELMVLRDLKQERERKSMSASSSSSKPGHKFWSRSGVNSGNNDDEMANSASASSLLPEEPPMGYALVTGASRGIGRAMAIELARWNIPLILLSRDTAQLSSLASDIERCYGVPCHILSADLSHGISEAKRVHEATRKAKLRVDILVNNAGICHYGKLVDMTPDQVKSVLNINTASVAALSQLYGNDMKKRKRGRIMIVSSIMGMLPSGPGISLYAATKSFQRSLAISMGRELEKHGVGVTCVCPGAVQTSDLRAGTKDAICWKFPFYVMQPDTIAHRSVSSMLLGDSELLPGWHNRGFVKGIIPLLPLRLSTMAVEFFWSPWNAQIRFPFIWENEKKGWKNKISLAKNKVADDEKEERMSKYKEEDLSKYTYPMKKISTAIPSKKRSSFWGGSSSSGTLTDDSLPPRLLNLPPEEKEEEIVNDDGTDEKSPPSLSIEPSSRGDGTLLGKQKSSKSEVKIEEENERSGPTPQKTTIEGNNEGEDSVLDAESSVLSGDSIESIDSEEIPSEEEPGAKKDQQDLHGDDNEMKHIPIIEAHPETPNTDVDSLVEGAEITFSEENAHGKSSCEVEKGASEPTLDEFETIVEENKRITEDQQINEKSSNKKDDGNAKQENQSQNNASFLQLEFVE